MAITKYIFQSGVGAAINYDSRIVVHVLPDKDALRNPLRNMDQPLSFILKQLRINLSKENNNF